MPLAVRDIKAPGTIHHSRWQRIKSGLTFEEVAAQDKVLESTVRDSFLQVEDYKSLCSRSALETVEIETIVSLKREQRQALREALQANEHVYKDVITADGSREPELVEVIPDHDTRLAAVAAINQKIAALQPRSGLSTNVNVNTKVGVDVSTGRTSFEDKLREILHKREEQKPPEVTVIDVPALEEGEDHESNLEDGEDTAEG